MRFGLEILRDNLFPSNFSDISGEMLIFFPMYLVIVIIVSKGLSKYFLGFRILPHQIVTFLLLHPIKKVIPYLIASEGIPVANHHEQVLGSSKSHVDSSLIC